MKKSIFMIASLFAATFANAQSYKIISRCNDTIRLQSNKLGEAMKSIVPGKSEVDNNYRLIEKEENGKKSLLFVEFSQILDKVFVSYETDLVHAGDWNVKAFSFNDIYNSVKRNDAILLKGQLLGMNIEIYQRPDNFKDIISIDGIEFPSPIKVSVFENKLVQDQQSKKSELSKLGLTDDDIKSTEGKANECYIAYLLISGKFNTSTDKALMKDICDQDEFIKLKAKYNEDQLKYLSKGYDNRLNKYSK